MRVGIITIPDFNNYGNRLQNYALQKVVEQLGHEAVSYVPFRPVFWKTYIKKWLRKENSPKRKHALGRLKSFLAFDKRYMKTESVKESVFPKELADRCDCFLAGSDQIWNPAWAKSLYDNMFLTFARPEQKIAYAPSFGVDHVSAKWADRYAEALKDFRTLSVREMQGAQTVKALTGRDAAVVVDPTLLLTGDEWRQIARMPKNQVSGEPYLLMYFLGEVPEAYQALITDFSKTHNCRILNFFEENNWELFDTGPSEFVGLIANAQAIFTDSFHASVFSTLFQKPFVVFDRVDKEKDMSSRIESLCQKLALESHQFSSPTFDKDTILHPDYTQSMALLERERKKSMDFLKSALNY